MRVKPCLIIRSFKKLGSISGTAKELGISRMSVYRWLKRAKTMQGYYSERNLGRKSTKPKHIHRKLSLENQSAIISLREQTGYAAVKIKGELKLSIGINTIHRLLEKKGLLNDYGNHRRPHYQQTVHMHLRNTTTIGKLQMDVKYLTPELTG